ncbi:hypothetical protein HY02_08075 [Peptococcaceae bacterium SCADC1_2_3]|nr:hypothetical protein DK28_0203465 [Peptococcaceae bacterium SCADC1_2_3]KFI35852.1 hypothetical protein HY00_00880 [Peptococcaceae bacterium SCADC1_2_3]KFI37323.1 hypothetical protein HY02_08075 [Peptococcaceae bacterium SCADC1_2_3]HBQ28180.1 hypothetical protein [Desulfotomaculum sp.]
MRAALACSYSFWASRALSRGKEFFCSSALKSARGVCWGSGLEISLFTILLISGGFPIALPFCSC